MRSDADLVRKWIRVSSDCACGDVARCANDAPVPQYGRDARRFGAGQTGDGARRMDGLIVDSSDRRLQCAMTARMDMRFARHVGPAKYGCASRMVPGSRYGARTVPPDARRQWIDSGCARDNDVRRQTEMDAGCRVSFGESDNASRSTDG